MCTARMFISLCLESCAWFEGYLTFDLAEMKIGDLPVPVSLVRLQLQSKLREPENREKMKLPSYVADLRVENGQLVILEK
jgi:hypothetical protein